MGRLSPRGSHRGCLLGAGAGLVAGAVVLVRAIARHKVHLFDVVGVVYFGGMLILLAALQPGDISTWGRWAQAVAHGSLTVIVFGSILIGHPFTEPYARERVPKQYWGNSDFRTVNRKISLVFGLAFLIGTAPMVVAGATNDLSLLLRLVVPFGAWALAFMYVQRQSAAAASGRSRAVAET
jgi:hypothetical protein